MEILNLEGHPTGQALPQHPSALRASLRTSLDRNATITIIIIIIPHDTKSESNRQN